MRIRNKPIIGNNSGENIQDSDESSTLFASAVMTSSTAGAAMTVLKA